MQSDQSLIDRLSNLRNVFRANCHDKYSAEEVNGKISACVDSAIAMILGDASTRKDEGSVDSFDGASTKSSASSLSPTVSVDPAYLADLQRREISVKSVFADETNLKAQLSVERLEQIEAHAEEGHKFGDSTNSVILELIHHIRAVEKVRDEWCMEYVKLRDTPEPVSDEVKEAREILEKGDFLGVEESEKLINDILTQQPVESPFIIKNQSSGLLFW